MPNKSINIQLRQETPIPLDLEFSCAPGEIVVVVGPSGSGKTTLLRSICGIHRPATGRISSNGTIWFDSKQRINLPVQQRRVGMVFQHYALFPHKTAIQNIIMAQGHLEKSQRLDKAHALLEQVHMHGLGDRYPHQLSGGQQQRIAVARALAREPDVLLLDEPFSAVDQQTRRKLVRELVQLRNRLDMPIIHVTHNLNEARRIADRICIIHRGKTLQIDTPQNIMTRPHNAEVAYQTGHSNIFSGTVSRHDAALGKTYIQWGVHEFECSHQPDFAPGTAVDWLIPAENLILHRRDRPSRGERENPVTGKISEMIPLGESTTVSVEFDDQQSMFMGVPTHVARRNGLETGATVTVSLLSEGIHLMTKAGTSSAKPS
ncbi:MAG: ABC transporter related protein [Gammaproteobacteria bacterium]|nr:ABC transporter related protein [Gammaproteobacteria bacterium]